MELRLLTEAGGTVLVEAGCWLVLEAVAAAGPVRTRAATGDDRVRDAEASA